MPQLIHITSFKRNLGDVIQLLNVHSLVARRVAGRATALQVLNRSAVVLLAACWEAYVEDLAVASFDWLLKNCPDPKLFPNKVRARATRLLREEKDELAIWALADGGWKSVLANHRDETIRTTISTFNSPKAAQVDTLYSSLIGLSSLSSHWRWPGTSADSARQRLERLLTIRGDIAHRAKHHASVKRPELDNFVTFTHRLAIQSHNTVVAYLEKITSRTPFPQLKYVALDIGSPSERRSRIKRSWRKRRAK